MPTWTISTITLSQHSEQESCSIHYLICLWPQISQDPKISQDYLFFADKAKYGRHMSPNKEGSSYPFLPSLQVNKAREWTYHTRQGTNNCPILLSSPNPSALAINKGPNGFPGRQSSLLFYAPLLSFNSKLLIWASKSFHQN